MSCNCATNKQINEIIDKFGHRTEIGAKKTLAFRVKKFFTAILVNIIVIFEIPYLIYYIIREIRNNDNKISLAKFLNLKNTEENNVRLQQILSNTYGNKQ